MAKLKAVVESLEGVPQELQPLYVERDGKFWLDADGVEDVTGLKTALRNERALRERAEKKLPEGFDPEDYAELLKLREEATKGKLSDKQREELESFKRQMQEQSAKEIQKREKEMERLRTALRQELVTGRATAALASAKGSVKLLLPHVERHATVTEVDGRFVPVVVDEEGHTRVGPSGANMTFEELVAEMRANAEYAGAFEGTGSSGGGAPRSAGGAGAGSKTVIPAGDQAAFLANLEGIAKGSVEVR